MPVIMKHTRRIFSSSRTESGSEYADNLPIPRTPKSTNHRYPGSGDSGYRSLESSPTPVIPRSSVECPTLARFSWQSGASQESWPTEAQNVEFKNDIWRQFQHHCDDAVTLRKSHTESPRPPSVFHTVAHPIAMSEALQDQKSNHERTGSGSNGQPANQPVLLLKDSGTSAFPSFRSVDHPSPSKSDCSEDDSTQTSSFQPSNSAMIQPSFHEMRIAGVGNPPGSSPNNLSGLVSNVYRTTGREPPGLVGASTTNVGDKLYVFGGRRLRPQRLTRTLYVLDLINRHWTKLETSGDVPSARFFHTLCALGDTKLVCYGGMALATQPATDSSRPASQSDVMMTVTSDIHVYDIATRMWKYIPTAESPPRRYAHCATILPSSAVFSSSSAPLSALRHNPPSAVPNQGTIGVSIDGRGGVEMIVVGGQDGQSHFIDSIEVFNFRSFKWSTSAGLSKSYGAYRSVIAPLIGFPASRIGKPTAASPHKVDQEEEAAAGYEDDTGKEHVSGSPMLIFSNYNFLNTRVEVQVRYPDGTLTEKLARSKHKPPGLRFPNGAVIDKHLIVSGTYITSSQQEYMIWALDLERLVWSRIDAGGGGGFNTGSWNRGVLWGRRNSYVLLGHRHRKLNEDYNTRRLNFANICIVELEAFGLYNNPKRDLHLGLQRLNSPLPGPSSGDLDRQSRDMVISQPVESLGIAAMTSIELCDMEILARDGERIPVNSHILRVRWGPYFKQLLSEDLTRVHGTSDAGTIRANNSIDITRNRSSISTVTPSSSSIISNGTTVVDSDTFSQRRPSVLSNSATSNSTTSNSTVIQDRRDLPGQAQTSRSRLLYLPHTYLTIRALVHYLYTTSLPALTSPFCTPQILCSLLQIARPYRIDGLLEATVERLHEVLDSRNTAAIFNAAAMAAGGGDSIKFVGDLVPTDALASKGGPSSTESSANGTVVRQGATSQQTMIEDDSEDAVSSASASTTSISDIEEDSRDVAPEIWKGDMSAVVGLQKRGLRGLMEGRRLRGQGKGGDEPGDSAGGGGGGAAVSNEGVEHVISPGNSSVQIGLGIG